MRFFVLFGLIVSFGSPVFADIARFVQVAPSIYRGGQPSEASDYVKLRSMGVATVLNLRTTDEEIALERSRVGTAGMDFVHVPMVPFLYPSDEDVATALRVLTDPARQPVFVHCREGKDRTGLIVGLYRVYFENWSRHRAWDEMRAIGFNELLVGLSLYFWTAPSPPLTSGAQ